MLHIFPSPPDAGKSHVTVAGWYVNDIEAVVDSLTVHGVRFERYDQPQIATDEKGIAILGTSANRSCCTGSGKSLSMIPRQRRHVGARTSSPGSPASSPSSPAMTIHCRPRKVVSAHLSSASEARL